MKRTSRVLTVLVALVATAFGACGGGGDGDAAGERPPKAVNIQVGASEYRFEMATEVSGTIFNVNMDNLGMEAHIAVVTKVAAGKTMEDVKKGDPAALEMVGGVATVDPGQRGTATFEIPPGSYIMACFIPAPDGQPHIAKGMSLPFTIKPAETQAKLPDASVELDGKEFSYSTNPSVKAGENVVRFNNKGKQDHEITVAELEPGKTVADIGAFFANPSGPPPFKMFGGVAVRPGESGTTKVDFKAGGNYLFACFIPDEADGQPNITKGMAAKVTVT